MRWSRASAPARWPKPDGSRSRRSCATEERIRMKAVLCKELGAPEKLGVDNVRSLKAGKGQVVIGVKACGVNFPDTLIIQGKYQFKPDLPFSPGGEVAGVVKEIGEGVNRVKVGDRVIA